MDVPAGRGPGERRVLRAGDASGMFPLDPCAADYDAERIRRFDDLANGVVPPLRERLPEVHRAGRCSPHNRAFAADPWSKFHSGITATQVASSTNGSKS